MNLEVKISNLYKKVNDNFTLELNDAVFHSGAVCGLAGDNGAGKTTLFRIIAGLDKNYKGSVLYDGTPLNSDILKYVTMTFQFPMLLNRSVYDNIEYPMKLRKIPKDMRKKATDELIDMLGISRIQKKNATQISGGESQKVSLARALASSPKLLLLDEVFSSIDINSINDIEKCILEYNKKTGATIIIVSHNKDQTKRICTQEVAL